MLHDKHAAQTAKEMLELQKERLKVSDKIAKDVENTALKESLKVRFVTVDFKCLLSLTRHLCHHSQLLVYKSPFITLNKYFRLSVIVQIDSHMWVCESVCIYIYIYIYIYMYICSAAVYPLVVVDAGPYDDDIFWC